MTAEQMKFALELATAVIDCERHAVAEDGLEETGMMVLSRALLASDHVVQAAQRWAKSHQPWLHAEAKSLDPREHPARDERELLDAVAALTAQPAVRVG